MRLRREDCFQLIVSLLLFYIFVENASGDLILLTVGEGEEGTFGYNLRAKEWETYSRRPEVGDHHGCEVWNNTLYLIGGFDSENVLQLYHPITDTWTIGEPAPLSRGSPSTGCEYTIQ